MCGFCLVFGLIVLCCWVVNFMMLVVVGFLVGVLGGCVCFRLAFDVGLGLLFLVGRFGWV